MEEWKFREYKLPEQPRVSNWLEQWEAVEKKRDGHHACFLLDRAHLASEVSCIGYAYGHRMLLTKLMRIAMGNMELRERDGKECLELSKVGEHAAKAAWWVAAKWNGFIRNHDGYLDRSDAWSFIYEGQHIVGDSLTYYVRPAQLVAVRLDSYELAKAIVDFLQYPAVIPIKPDKRHWSLLRGALDFMATLNIGQDLCPCTNDQWQEYGRAWQDDRTIDACINLGYYEPLMDSPSKLALERLKARVGNLDEPHYAQWHLKEPMVQAFLLISYYVPQEELKKEA